MSNAKPGLSRGAKVALGLVALGAVCLPCIGAGAIVAMPALTQYLVRTKAAEARMQLAVLQRSVDAFGGLPASLPPTPDLAGLGPEARPWPSTAAPGWSALGFTPTEPVRYSYAVTSDPLLSTVRIEAFGDLNGNGIRSSYARIGHYVAGEGITWDELIVLDELE
jgi:hypothetical protein